MIDFHAHILPAIDDGARNTEVALDMLSKSYIDGVDTVVSTSHCYINHGNASIDRFLQKRTTAYSSLLNAAKSGNIPRIILASEVRIKKGMSKCKNFAELRIQNTDYILLEMPYDRWTDDVFEEIYHVIRLGLRPIIAHLDRYPDKKKQIDELLSLDVLCQINAGAFLDKNSRKTVMHLLERDGAHIIGSDMHNTTSRPPNLAEAYTVLNEKFGKKYYDFFQTNSECILNNGTLGMPQLPKLGLIKKMFL